jgi:translation elongation factor EF-Tu-like GTPase
MNRMLMMVDRKMIMEILRISISGKGTVAEGIIECDSVTEGNEVEIQRSWSNKPARSRVIEIKVLEYGNFAQTAHFNWEVGLLLEGLSPQDIRCGDSIDFAGEVVKCPNCGANVTKRQDARAVCEYCNSLI